MMRLRRAISIAAIGAGALALAAPMMADAVAAERQYRVARRLAAERSPDAVAALQKVVELDPAGPLADDARVDLARFYGVPDWPESIGRSTREEVETVRGLLDGALATDQGDRAIEARYYRALLALEPFPGRDESDARLQLIAVATDVNGGEWASRARYTNALLDERTGDLSGARAAFQRIIIDDPAHPVALRARVGVARVLLASGAVGRAAEWAQSALDRGVSAESGAEAVREAAVRQLLARTGMPDEAAGLAEVAPVTAARSPAQLVTTLDGGIVIGDKRSGTIVRLDSKGRLMTRWEVPRLSAIGATPDAATIYAADADSLLRLVEDSSPHRIAQLGEFATPQAIVTDGTGRFWVLDRKGQRLGRVDVETGTVILAGKLESRVTGLQWNRGRMIGLDTRNGSVVAISPTGAVAVFGYPGAQRATDLAAGPSGTVAVLDTKASSVIFMDRTGHVLGARAVVDWGPQKPVAIALGPDGALHVFDGASTAWWKTP